MPGFSPDQPSRVISCGGAVVNHKCLFYFSCRAGRHLCTATPLPYGACMIWGSYAACRPRLSGTGSGYVALSKIFRSVIWY